MTYRLQVTGLKELQGALRRVDADLPKELRKTLNGVSQLVIDYAKPRVPSRTGRAAASLKVRSSQREARIAAGGSRAPYYPWLDFGGRVGKGRSVKRPFYREGRYIYPGLRANSAKITEVMEAAVVDLCRRSGFVVD